ncbi:hypothetical protein METHP14_70074 [Pseudomonas sp. P14-2025]
MTVIDPKLPLIEGNFRPKAVILFLAYRIVTSQLLAPHKLELTDHIFLPAADFKLGSSTIASRPTQRTNTF